MIRTFKNKDVNYVIDAHWRIYNYEYNYDNSFKDFITKSVNSFIKDFDNEKENLWILDIDGNPKGSIGILQDNEDTAQLRWFLVEPEVRGNGFGKRLIQEAIKFCEAKNYKKVVLTTNSSLVEARKLYKFYGFNISEVEKQILSNQEIITEKWELIL